MSHWDYFFDFLTHIQKYYMRTSAKDGMSHDPFFWPLKYFTRSFVIASVYSSSKNKKSMSVLIIAFYTSTRYDHNYRMFPWTISIFDIPNFDLDLEIVCC